MSAYRVWRVLLVLARVPESLPLPKPEAQVDESTARALKMLPVRVGVEVAAPPSPGEGLRQARALVTRCAVRE